MELNIQRKLQGIPPSIFPIMTGLANQYNAVNLAQGFPGFDADKDLIQLVNHYMLAGKKSICTNARCTYFKGTIVCKNG